MLKRSLFSRSAPPKVRAVPTGERIYAIGDIHGRSDCLDALIAAIDADDRARGPARTTLIFLGDLIDRGADSRGVIERAMIYAATRRSVFLLGNHEEVLIGAWEGDAAMARLFHRIGGRATLMSYGVDPDRYDAGDINELVALIAEAIPVTHINFLKSFEDSLQVGDYLFVHAGVKPGVEIAAQQSTDMRWIREVFLNDRREHGAIVVHGHSSTEAVDERVNRIGIDTRAYATGELTAIGIEGTARWFLSGNAPDESDIYPNTTELG